MAHVHCERGGCWATTAGAEHSWRRALRPDMNTSQRTAPPAGLGEEPRPNGLCVQLRCPRAAGAGEARLGALVDALKLAEAARARGSRPVRPGPGELVALARVARLRLQLRDARRVGRHGGGQRPPGFFLRALSRAWAAARRASACSRSSGVICRTTSRPVAMSRSISSCRAAFLVAAISLCDGRRGAMASPCSRTRSRFRGAEPSCDRVLDGPAGKLGAAAQAGLLADAGEVVLHRAGRDVQLDGDLLVGVSGGDEAQDLVFALAEKRAYMRGLAARRAGVLGQE